MHLSTSSSVGFRPSVSVRAPLSSAALFKSSGTDLCLLTSETREILKVDRVHSHNHKMTIDKKNEDTFSLSDELLNQTDRSDVSIKEITKFIETPCY